MTETSLDVAQHQIQAAAVLRNHIGRIHHRPTIVSSTVAQDSTTNQPSLIDQDRRTRHTTHVRRFNRPTSASHFNNDCRRITASHTTNE